MSLTIERFATRCRISPYAKLDRVWVERVVREELPRECGRLIDDEWERGQAVIRVRRLQLALNLATGHLDSRTAAAAWTEALVNALRRALASNTGENFRAESRAEWIGRFLVDVLAGTASGRWEYAEFWAESSGSAAQIVLATIAREAAIAPAALAWLMARGQLERLLAIFDQGGLIEFCARLGDRGTSGDGTFSLGELTQIARAFRRHVPRQTGARIATPSGAIRLFVALHVEAAASRSALQLYHALMTLELLVEANGWSDADPMAAPPPQVATSYFAARAILKAAIPDRTAGDETEALLHEIDDLRRQGFPAGGDAQWLASDCAGIFLLADRVARLGWPARWQQSSLGAEYGSRLGTYCLAGVALAILGKELELSDRLDPAIAIFAGWFGDPEVAGFRAFLKTVSCADRAELLRVTLCDDYASIDRETHTWEMFFNAMADWLICDFAATLRGFREASRAFIVRNFVAVPGRLQVEEQRVRVELAIMPLQVVLRVAGALCPVETASWLNGRRIEFDLG